MEKRSRDFSISYVNKVVHNRRNIYFHGAISREAKLFFNPQTTFSQFQSRINIRLCKSIDSGWVINEISVASLKKFFDVSITIFFPLFFSLVLILLVSGKGIQGGPLAFPSCRSNFFPKYPKACRVRVLESLNERRWLQRRCTYVFNEGEEEEEKVNKRNFDHETKE